MRSRILFLGLMICGLCATQTSLAGPPKTKAPAFTVQFSPKVTWTFVKLPNNYGNWIAVQEQGGKLSYLDVSTVCSKMKAGRTTDDMGTFLAMGKPGKASLNRKTGRIELRWKIEATYDGTGNGARVDGLLFLNQAGQLVCKNIENQY